MARRSQAGILVVAILSLAAALPEAVASPARRLARRGVVLAPPPGTAIVPPAGPLRPNPLLAVPIAPGGPAIVIGPGGRVRRRLAMPAPGGPPGGVVTVTESPAATVARPAPPAAAPQQAAMRPAPAPATAAASPPRPAPAPLAVEPIPAPLPVPRPAPAGDVVPTGGELEIPDGTQSVLVEPAGGAPRPANR
ncbi:MAG: hypothetical protein ACKOC4_03265 [Planctomycetia bacterium]